MARADRSVKVRGGDGAAAPDRLVRLELEGFKSFRDRTSVEIRPLTVLAGRNSSGKSSLVQPLLLMKQTMEASHDPGALELAGPCVTFTQAAQLLWQGAGETPATEWTCTLTVEREPPGSPPERTPIAVSYKPGKRGGIELASTRIHADPAAQGWVLGDGAVAWPPSGRIADLISARFPGGTASVPQSIFDGDGIEVLAEAERVAHLLLIKGRLPDGGPANGRLQWGMTVDLFPRTMVQSLIFLPGLRGMPQRTYPLARASGRFPGPFPPYVASVLHDWSASAPEKIGAVAEDLRQLGLTWKVEARPVDDTAVEVRVGRLPSSRRGGANDLVSIADVGVGTSQVLPVVVALHAALPGQIVHVEQPELHLHPRAQVTMAQILARAAQRGVIVIAETHSSLLLTALQTLIARHDANLDPALVALHWFDRDAAGATQVKTAELDEDGSYGDWPVDFADVEMDAERAFVEAAISRAATGM